MGKELTCTVRFGKQESTGKALLETNEILFRGGFRLKIALREIKSVKAVNGELLVDFPGGKAAFVLGAQAEKWAHKILHPKTVIEKLGVKERHTISAVGITDASFLKQLKERSAKLAPGKPVKDCDVIFLGAGTAGELAKIKSLTAFLKKDGALWIVYPKGQKAITEGDVLAAGRKAGWKDVKVVGFSETHTALKFVLPLAKR
ncbi:MAG TPA: hypothetical protein VKA02_02885 [Candidatus Acidoferrum sp.]|nr:hypothetical protein [Candidatus Acidoferrum sp.]HXR33243.1 hypothetical protein [Verrucomicrobiae bacterium]